MNKSPNLEAEKKKKIINNQAERGMVTVELAIGLAAALSFMLLILGVWSASVTYMKATDAVRVAARSLAAGEKHSQVKEVVRDIAGTNAKISVNNEGDYLRVTVTRPYAWNLLGTAKVSTVVLKEEKKWK